MRPGIPLSKTDFGAVGGSLSWSIGSNNNDSNWRGNDAVITTRMIMTMQHREIESSLQDQNVCRQKD